MRGRALLAAEAARTAKEEAFELDDASYVDPGTDAGVSFWSQEGRSAFDGGARAGLSDSAGSGGAWSA
eukprot:1782262-Alexandrium_andersonii.AAC.1